jgi:hypothetical protein
MLTDGELRSSCSCGGDWKINNNYDEAAGQPSAIDPTEPRHHVVLSNNTSDVIDVPRWHWRKRISVYHICCIRYFYSTPDTNGSIAGSLSEIYRVGDSARCRINFARKGILLCCLVYFDGVFWHRVCKFGVLRWKSLISGTGKITSNTILIGPTLLDFCSKGRSDVCVIL